MEGRTKVRSITLETTLIPSIAGMCEMLLVRHGEQVFTGEQTTAEAHDPPLSELGERQAAALAARLRDADFHAVYSSPLRRAVDTASIISAEHALAPVIMPELAEFDPWAQLDPERPVGEQLAREEISAIFREHSATRRWDAFRYSEDLASFRARVIDGLEALMGRHESERIVVVCHSGVINTYLSFLLKSELDLLVRVHHTSLTVVRGADDRRAVIAINDHGHVLPFQTVVNDSNL